jgi:hypothetical protein
MHDDLLARLEQSKLGCHTGIVYVGVLAHADVITLLFISADAMRKMLFICI